MFPREQVDDLWATKKHQRHRQGQMDKQTNNMQSQDCTLHYSASCSNNTLILKQYDNNAKSFCKLSKVFANFCKFAKVFRKFRTFLQQLFHMCKWFYSYSYKKLYRCRGSAQSILSLAATSDLQAQSHWYS